MIFFLDSTNELLSCEADAYTWVGNKGEDRFISEDKHYYCKLIGVSSTYIRISISLNGCEHCSE